MSKLKCWLLSSWFNLDLFTLKLKLIVKIPYANYFTELNQIPIAQYKLSGLIILKLQILTNMMGRQCGQRERASKMAQSSQTWTDQMHGIEDLLPCVWSDYLTSSSSSKTMVKRFMLFFFHFRTTNMRKQHLGSQFFLPTTLSFFHAEFG